MDTCLLLLQFSWKHNKYREIDAWPAFHLLQLTWMSTLSLPPVVYMPQNRDWWMTEETAPTVSSWCSSSKHDFCSVTVMVYPYWTAMQFFLVFQEIRFISRTRYQMQRSQHFSQMRTEWHRDDVCLYANQLLFLFLLTRELNWILDYCPK